MQIPPPQESYNRLKVFFRFIYAILALVWIVKIEIALTGCRHLQTDSQVRKQEAECQEVGAWALCEDVCQRVGAHP